MRNLLRSDNVVIANECRLDRKEAMNRPGPIHAEREVHDYDEISQQTPVFCTSSQVYMKMRGFVMSEDDSTPGYISEEDTEIPQLQIHAQNLTENLRIGKHKEVLSGICQVLNSIVIWAQNEKGSSASIDIETLKTMFTVFEAVSLFNPVILPQLSHKQTD